MQSDDHLFLHTRQGFPRFSPVLDILSCTRGCKTTTCMMSGRDRKEPNRTFLDWKCTYFGVKSIKYCIFKLKCNCQRKCMQKKSIMVVQCELKILSLRITVWHHSASLVMPNSYPHNGIFNPHLTSSQPLKIFICFHASSILAKWTSPFLF